MKIVGSLIVTAAVIVTIILVVIWALNRDCAGTVQFNNGTIIRIHKNVSTGANAEFCEIDVTARTKGCESGDQYPKCTAK